MGALALWSWLVRHVDWCMNMCLQRRPLGSYTAVLEVMAPPGTLTSMARCCAEVRGPVSDELQMEFDAFLSSGNEFEDLKRGRDSAAATVRDASPTRQLLMKEKDRTSAGRLANISDCGLCFMQQCERSAVRCFGLCKKNGRLFNCSSRKKDLIPCRRGSSWRRTETLVADALDLHQSVVVKASTASARRPVIPCAEVAGQPTGCPAPGTPHLEQDLFDGTRLSLQDSRCITRRLPLQECESPFYPLGFCECLVTLEAEDVSKGGFNLVSSSWRPCSTVDFAVDTFPRSENIDVSTPRPGEVVTRYVEHPYADESAPPSYIYNTTFAVRGGQDVAITLETYRGFTVRADRFTFNRTLPDDNADGTGRSDEYDDFGVEAEERYIVDRYLTDEESRCFHECWIEGDGVVGYAREEFDVEEPEYSIYYYTDSSCPQCGESPEFVRPRRYSLFRGDVPQEAVSG